MNAKYVIADNQTLVFYGKPKSLQKKLVRETDFRNVKSVVVPNSVLTIGKEALSDLYIKTVHISNSTTNIKWRAFYACNYLDSIYIPNSVINIEQSAFKSCPALTCVHIPNSVSNIKWLTFGYCSALECVHIPNSILAIGWKAFQHCEAMTSVYLPSSVKTIDLAAFKNCKDLASIHIPTAGVTICSAAFIECPRLHKVYMPANAKVDIGCGSLSFEPETALIRPRIKPIRLLQKKSTCSVSKAAHSVYL